MINANRESRAAAACPHCGRASVGRSIDIDGLRLLCDRCLQGINARPGRRSLFSLFAARVAALLLRPPDRR